MRREALEILTGGLWHTTHPARFRSILNDKAILPEPNIPNSERWKTFQGPEYYPYVRTLGGVSLFDLREFDPEEYSNDYPSSTWEVFIPFRKEWGESVWIEIDYKKMGSNLLSGAETLTKWKEEKAYKNTIMPHIEAAHIGPIDAKFFKQALLIGPDNGKIKITLLL